MIDLVKLAFIVVAPVIVPLVDDQLLNDVVCPVAAVATKMITFFPSNIGLRLSRTTYCPAELNSVDITLMA